MWLLTYFVRILRIFIILKIIFFIIYGLRYITDISPPYRSWRLAVVDRRGTAERYLQPWSLEDGLSRNRDEEKKSKGSCIYAVGSHEYQVVCTRPGITSADVGMLDRFDRGLQTDVHAFVDYDYAMGISITAMGRSITMYGFMIQECAVSWKAMLRHMMTLLTTEAEYMTLAGELKENWLKGLSTELGFELKLVAGIATGALTKAVPGPRFQHWLKLLRIGEG